MSATASFDAPPAQSGSRLSQEKRDGILRAAREVFLAKGYEGASMNEITRLAGGSKASLYAHFGSKEALFGALIASECAELVQPLLPAEAGTAPPEVVLPVVGEGFLRLILWPVALSLYRVVVAEAPRFPELGRAFYDNGPGLGLRTLAGYLAEQARLGRLEIADPVLAGEHFCGLVLGHAKLKTVLGLTRLEDIPDPAGRVAAAVRVFLKAYGRDRTL